ncbi:hypothetical protein HOLleu_36501 [Holothuria leucospilota]|uniref:Uncharacterized protein n=1 Tax=Holothuria leucospilota TaxID=206669 RepID=A0A9Q0YNM9_HOLLE|nr:hypothetical protein HOLleu_36501 [Holothuria leucospilota]
MVFKLNRQKENMDIGIILSIAIMWPFTTVHCRRPCALNKMVDVRGLYQQNIDLVCKHSPNCTRVFWKRHQDVGRPEPISNRCEECVYKVTNNAVDGTSILHIQNLSGNVKGVYTCYCNFVVRNSTLLSRSTEACYNLTIDTLGCGMKASIKGQRTLTYNGNHLGHIAETLDANINDVLSVSCLNDEQKETNCSELEKYKHGKARNNQGEGVVSYLNANLDKKLDSPVYLTKDISDIESDSFSSDEEETSHSSKRFKVRKERFTSLHIYEDANNGGTS